MIELGKSEMQTLYEINRHPVFPENFRPSSRRRLERMRLVENVMPANRNANYQLTTLGERLLESLFKNGKIEVQNG